MNCAHCGKSNPAPTRFCGHCGQLLSSDGIAPEPLQTAAAAVVGGFGPATVAPTGRLQSLLERAWHLLVSPRHEWARIAGEQGSVSSLYAGYAVPIVGFATALSFLQRTLIGTWVPLAGTVKAAPLVALQAAVASFVFGLIGLFVVGLVIHLLAPAFGARRDLGQALKAAVYSATPACIASVFSLLPALGALMGLLLMLYGIYILYLGLMPVMSAPRERAVGYTAAVVVVTLVLSLLVGALGAATFGLSRNAATLATLGRLQTPAERQHQQAEQVGNVIGNLLGTDRQGQAQLGAAIENLAKAGAQAPAASVSGTAGSSGAAQTADPPGNPTAAAAGLLTALGGALGGSHRVDPVDFNTLENLLPPSLPGLQRTTAQGSSQQALGVKASSAHAVYSGPAGRRVQIDIADASGVSGLLDLADALPQTTSASSDTGFERQSTVAGYAAHEKFDSRSRHAEIDFILAKRFTVELVGDGMDLGTLERYAGNIDLARLAAMKNAGAHAN